jgi:hypothetical protein
MKHIIEACTKQLKNPEVAEDKLDEDKIEKTIATLIHSVDLFRSSKQVHKSNDSYLLISYDVKRDSIESTDIDGLNRIIKTIPVYWQILPVAKNLFRINFVGYT